MPKPAFQFASFAGRLFFSLIFTILLASGLSACSDPGKQVEPDTGPALVSERHLGSENWDEFKWSPDGRQLLLSQWKYQEMGSGDQWRINSPMAIADADSGNMELIPKPGYAPLWSPDGEFILIRSAGDKSGEEFFWIYSTASDQFFRLPAIPNSYFWAWMEEGLVYQDQSGLWQIQIEGLDSAGSLPSLLTYAEAQRLLVFEGSDFARWAQPAPDKQAYLLVDNTDLDRRPWWLVQPDGEQVELGQKLYSLGSCCAWSGDGKHLAYFGLAPGQGLYITDSNGKNSKLLVSAAQMGEGAFLALDFSPNGKWIAFNWTEAGEGFPFDRNQIYVVRVDGKGLRQLTVDDSHPHNWLSWSPDGKYIAFKGANQDIWLAEVQWP